MSLDNFIPQLWAGAILKNLNDAHVYAQGFNRDYEGEIKQKGDSVRINSIGRVTIKDYSKNTNIDAPETLEDSQMVLQIDQAKYFNFAIDAVDKAQSSVSLMSAFAADASWGLADAADTYLAESLAANAATILPAATVGTGASDDDAYELLVDMAVALDENNVPDTGRWIVVPPWFHGMLLKDPRFVSFGTERNRNNLRGSPVGTAAGFEIRRSNKVPQSGGAYTLLAGHKIACTFAEQVREVEAYKPELRFGDALKGLYLFGCKVTRPYGIVMVAASKA